jgi:murein DD-endopeptidase MepM/ murein hydrolase activator NlpD
MFFLTKLIIRQKYFIFSIKIAELMKFWQVNLLDKIKNNYRLIIRNEDNLKERYSITLKIQNVMILVSMLFLTLGTITYLGLAFTPLSALLPRGKGGNKVQSQYNLMLRIDSLESVIKGLEYKSNLLDEILQTGSNSDFVKEESFIEDEKPVEKNEIKTPKTPSNISLSKLQNINFQFISPISGVITDTFNAERNHYGIDIAAKEKSIVRSVQGGTVIYNGWSPDFGHVLIIQHNNDFLSVYKHNSVVLKKRGTLVKTGEAIALVGNTGNLSTGTHLHFELWNNGVPVNPKKLIVF